MKKLEISQRGQKNKSDLTLEQLVKQVCKFRHIDESHLLKKSRECSSAKVRAMIAWLAIEFKVSKLTKIAVYLNRDPSTICRTLNQIAPSEQSALSNIKKFIRKANTQT